MSPSQSWPVMLCPGKGYVPDVDGSTNGRVVGVIHSFDDELIFEAWRFTSKRPVKLQNGESELRSMHEALALFYRHNAVRTSPPPGWLRQRIKLGTPQWVPSVRWWGCSQPKPCVCYADGCIEAHKYRWEGWQLGMRRVLVKPQP